MSQNSTMGLTKGAPMRQLLLFSLPLVYCSVMTILFLRKRTRQTAQTVGAAKQSKGICYENY